MTVKIYDGSIATLSFVLCNVCKSAMRKDHFRQLNVEEKSGRLQSSSCFELLRISKAQITIIHGFLFFGQGFY